MAIQIATSASELLAEVRRRAAQRSGYARYGMHRADGQQTDADEPEWDRARAAYEAEGVHTPGENPWSMVQRRIAEARAREAAEHRPRSPGWQVPAAQAESWPLYRNEAVTFDTEWGAVTLGRSLARIYDLEGWPEAEVLAAMAVRQAVPA